MEQFCVKNPPTGTYARIGTKCVESEIYNEKYSQIFFLYFKLMLFALI